MKLATRYRFPLRRSPNGLLQGFTLTETLVAVTVIAILAYLGVSVAGQARDRSMDAKCLSNIRATGAGALHYFADHNGKFLPTKYWYSRLSTAESPGIRDYLGSTSTTKSNSPEYYYDSVLTCPKLKVNHPQKFPNFMNRSYSMNRSLVTKDTGLPDVPDAPDNPSSPQRIANVPNVSKMWIFTDGATSNPKNAEEYATIISLSSVNGNQLTYPHNERQNTVFLDGHVESLKEAEFKTPSNRREFWGDLTITK